MKPARGNWPRRGASYGRGRGRDRGRGSNRTRSRFPQNGASPKTITYYSLNKVKVYHLITNIKNKGKDFEEFKKTFADPRKDPAVVEFSCRYNFTSRQFDMKVVDTGKGSIRISSQVVSCGKKIMQCDWNENEMRMDLSERHVLDKNFYLTLNCTLNNSIIIESKFHFKVPYFRTETEMVFRKMEQFDPSETITRIFHQKSKGLTTLESYIKRPLYSRFKKAIQFEHLAGREAIKHLAFEKAKIEIGYDKENECEFYFLKISAEREKEIMAERWKEMTMCLVPMDEFDEIYNGPGKCTNVQIDSIHKKKKFIKIDTEKLLNTTDLQHIDFIPNRIGYRACSKALEDLNSFKSLESFYLNFKEPSPSSLMSRNMKSLQLSPLESYQFEWYNKSIETNTEQKLAIRNIVNCTALPFPQVVFGPPGTGKTTTLVECVAQILKLRPDSRVLITTQSNSASDDIGLRLLKFVSIDQVYRFYSPSLLNPSSDGPNPTLKVSSNLRNKKLEWPLEQELDHFRVVISTLITSSRLARLDLAPGYFDYIFIDEISCATEPEALVPIVGLGMSRNTITANIVLLGDHLQLGPVLMSEEYAEKLGLGVSMMERLMATEKYLKKPTYDDRYVVQLLDNYRSHPAILKFSSDQFYDGALRAKMSLADQKLTEALNFLPNKKFPIIFHAVETPSQLNGTSSYNDGEIEVVKFYVRKLLATKFGGVKLKQSDIGVISPYLAQLAILNKVIGSNFPKVEMGTTEHFQGRQKRVIIITTVKSQRGIGFLSNQKRCNVMLTRAKSLEIVIGNPDTLRKDPFWGAFGDYCQLNGAFADELSSRLTKLKL